MDPTQVRIIEELAARIKRLLDTREIYIQNIVGAKFTGSKAG